MACVLTTRSLRLSQAIAPFVGAVRSTRPEAVMSWPQLAVRDMLIRCAFPSLITIRPASVTYGPFTFDNPVGFHIVHGIALCPDLRPQCSPALSCEEYSSASDWLKKVCTIPCILRLRLLDTEAEDFWHPRTPTLGFAPLATSEMPKPKDTKGATPPENVGA